jgi:hypothetical protein
MGDLLSCGVFIEVVRLLVFSRALTFLPRYGVISIYVRIGTSTDIVENRNYAYVI